MVTQLLPEKKQLERRRMISERCDLETPSYDVSKMSSIVMVGGVRAF